MKDKNLLITGITISTISLLMGAFIGLSLLFGGTESITFETGDVLNINRNESVIYDFIFESSGWATIHHMKNYYVIVFFSSIIFLFSRGFKKNEAVIIDTITNDPALIKKIKRKASCYSGILVIILTLGFAALWEVVEKLIVFITQVAVLSWPQNSLFIFFSDYVGTGEPIYNTLLSDLPQAIFAATGYVLLIKLKIIKTPTSFLSIQFTWIQTGIRFCLFGVFGFGALLITFKKMVGSRIIPLGFISYLFLYIFFLSALFSYDIWYIMKNKVKIMTTKERTFNYFTDLLYWVLQWFGAWFLIAPGFITSNGAFIVYLAILIILKVFIFAKEVKGDDITKDVEIEEVELEILLK
jgi:hypothetical protein